MPRWLRQGLKRIVVRIPFLYRLYLRVKYDGAFTPASFNERNAVMERSITATPTIKVNLGCGGNWQVDGWLGIDNSNTAFTWQKGTVQNYINLDVTKGLPFADNSVDVLFSSHALEHFTYNEAIALLFEIYRVLKIGGSLCLVVPDLDVFIDKLSQRDRVFLTTPDIIGGQPKRNLTDNFLMNFYSDPSFNNTCHKYAYNVENLSASLAMVGFESLERVEFHQFSYWPELQEQRFISRNPHIEKFSLCVQARKLNYDHNYRNRPELIAAQHFGHLNGGLGPRTGA
jgi:predicted SAM-dependent methyltransferase